MVKETTENLNRARRVGERDDGKLGREASHMIKGMTEDLKRLRRNV